MYLTDFCLCVYLYLFLVSNCLYQLFIHQLMQLSSQFTERLDFQSHGLKIPAWAGIAASVKSRNLGLQEGLRSIPHQYHSSFHSPILCQTPSSDTHTCSSDSVYQEAALSIFYKFFFLSLNEKTSFFFQSKKFPKRQKQVQGDLNFL